MGIKFLCPNGHKLHVKSFLAGKRAICPQCGERVIVPAEDQTGASDAGNVSVELPTISEPAAAPTLDLEDAQVAESAVASGAKMAPTTDPIAEAPSAVWYVRPATGGQFGPASGDIMRNWVRDGRVGASSLVWRAGWEEWRSAAEVFTELQGMLNAPTMPAAATANSGPLPSLPQGLAVQNVAPISPPPSAESTSTSPLPQAIRKRRRRNEVSLMTSGVLLAIAVILVIVLLLVFRSRMAPNELTPPADSAPPPAKRK